MLALKLKDPLLRNFWQNEFENYPDRFQKEAISPIQIRWASLQLLL